MDKARRITGLILIALTFATMNILVTLIPTTAPLQMIKALIVVISIAGSVGIVAILRKFLFQK